MLLAAVKLLKHSISVKGNTGSAPESWVGLPKEFVLKPN